MVPGRKADRTVDCGGRKFDARMFQLQPFGNLQARQIAYYRELNDLLSKVLLWLAAFLFIGAVVILVAALTGQSRNNA